MPHRINLTEPVYCDQCGELARRYYLGNRCPAHAPTERQVVEHAVRVATERDARERAQREHATPTRPMESR